MLLCFACPLCMLGKIVPSAEIGTLSFCAVGKYHEAHFGTFYILSILGFISLFLQMDSNLHKLHVCLIYIDYLRGSFMLLYMYNNILFVVSWILSLPTTR